MVLFMLYIVLVLPLHPHGKSVVLQTVEDSKCGEEDQKEVEIMS